MPLKFYGQHNLHCTVLTFGKLAVTHDLTPKKLFEWFTCFIYNVQGTTMLLEREVITAVFRGEFCSPTHMLTYPVTRQHKLGKGVMTLKGSIQGEHMDVL